MYSTEFAFDGSELVEWPTRMYGPTCSKCEVRFCGFTGRIVCPGCTPWEDIMPRETIVVEEPAMSPLMALTVSAVSRWAAHQEAGHTVRAGLWRWVAEALNGVPH